MKSCLSAVILIIWFIYSSYFVFAVAQPLYHSSLLLGCFCYCKIWGTLLKRSYTGKLPLYFTWPSISFPSFLPSLSPFFSLLCLLLPRVALVLAMKGCSCGCLTSSRGRVAGMLGVEITGVDYMAKCFFFLADLLYLSNSSSLALGDSWGSRFPNCIGVVT